LNVLGRHLTHLAVGGRNKDSIAEDEERLVHESIRPFWVSGFLTYVKKNSIKKKSRLLLGKKVFSSF